MTKFEYLTVLLSIVVAFAISEIVTGWGHQLRSGGRVRGYAVHTLWTVLLLLVTVQYWWGVWNYRDVEVWTFFAFLALVLPAFAIILVAFLVSPVPRGDEVLDLRTYYYGNRRSVFLLAALIIVGFGLADLAVLHQRLLHSENGMRAGAIALLVWLAFSGDERVHVGVLVALYALLAAFVFVATWSIL